MAPFGSLNAQYAQQPKILTDVLMSLQVYHVSRESFLYLSEFYIGEVAPEDRPLVPVLEVKARECMSV
jgi:hypothetical protein